MTTEFLNELNRLSMLEGTKTVIVAYSGGADSTALLHLFASHRRQLGIEVLAAHVNHGLREQSGQEAAHAARFCESLGIPLLLLEAKMNEQQKPQGLGTEAWARQIRYRWFDALAQQHRAKVATGHTATDNVETILFRMARGTGLAGLCGIPPVRGVYIRPLLAFSRVQIEQYCAENHLEYVTDHTNLEDDFARNRLRHGALPALASASEGYEGHFAALADEVRQLYDYVSARSRQLLNQAAVGEGYDTQKLAAAPAALRRQALHRLLWQQSVQPSRQRIAELESLLQKEGAAALGGGLVAKSAAGVLHIGAESSKPLPPLQYDLPLRPGHFVFPGGFSLWVLALTPAQWEKGKNSGQLLLENAADCDKIPCNALWRTRRAADRLRPRGRGISKPLKKWMNEQALPLSHRRALPLLAAESNILFVPGYGFSDGLAPDENTRRIVYLSQHKLQGV